MTCRRETSGLSRQSQCIQSNSSKQAATFDGPFESLGAAHPKSTARATCPHNQDSQPQTKRKKQERAKDTPRTDDGARSWGSRRNQPCATSLLFSLYQHLALKSTPTRSTPILSDLSWIQSRDVLGRGQGKKTKLAGQLLLVVASVKSALAQPTCKNGPRVLAARPPRRLWRFRQPAQRP